MTESAPSPQSRPETYAGRLARTLIENWANRPVLDPYGRRYVITVHLEVHLSTESECELRSLLYAEGLSFDFDMAYKQSRLEWQRNTIHVQRRGA